MRRETFNRQFAALVNAYTIASKLAEESQDIYWEMLKDIPDYDFVMGVKKCLQDLKWFPTIHELGAASLPRKLKIVRHAVRFVTYEQDWAEQAAELKTRHGAMTMNKKEVDY